MQKPMHRIPMQSKNNIEESQQPSFQQQLLPVLQPCLSGSRVGNFGFQSHEVKQGSRHEGCSLLSLWLLAACLHWAGEGLRSGWFWEALTVPVSLSFSATHCLCVLACYELGEAGQRLIAVCRGCVHPFCDTSFAAGIRWAELSCGSAFTFPFLPELVCVLGARLQYQQQWLSSLRMRNREGYQTPLLSWVHWADRAAFGTTPTIQSPKLPHCNVF